MKTRAAVCRAFGQPLTIEEIELAEPGPGELRVKIKACAICHSDIFYADGAWGGELPAVYGHEAAGVVEAVGPGVKRVKVGDPVVATLIRSCGFCDACAGGGPVYCEEVFPLDEATPLHDSQGNPIVHGMRTGAFAEHAIVEESQVAKIPADLAFDAASLIACGVITGFGAVVNTAKVPTGASVVVIGCGGVGLAAINGAAIAGASRIIAVDMSPAKDNLARHFGATDFVNGADADAVKTVLDLTKGGVDHAFEAVGLGKTAEQAFGMLKRGGTAYIIGMIPIGQNVTIPGAAFLGEKKLQGSLMGSNHFPVDMPRLVDMYLSGKLLLDDLISRRIKLEDVNEAFTEMKTGQIARSVIIFDA